MKWLEEKRMKAGSLKKLIDNFVQVPVIYPQVTTIVDSS